MCIVTGKRTNSQTSSVALDFMIGHSFTVLATHLNYLLKKNTCLEIASRRRRTHDSNRRVYILFFVVIDRSPRGNKTLRGIRLSV